MFVDLEVQALFFVTINIYRSFMIPCDFFEKENVLNNSFFKFLKTPIFNGKE